MFSELESRMNFHFDRALHGIIYTVKHDFIRGWEVRDERIIRFVTGPYHETTFMFENVLSEIKNSNSSRIKNMLWYPLELKLLSKADYLARAEYNATGRLTS